MLLKARKGGISKMLRIYICPKCYNFRMVSRKPDAICFHCGTTLEQCDLEYSAYMNMTEEERNTYKENFKKRMMLYSDKILQVHSMNN
jgi:ribosomal protein L37AE/L43A